MRERLREGIAALAPASAVVTGVGAVLLVLLAWAVLHLPPSVQVGVALGATLAVAFFARPELGLFAVVVGRVLVDLLWWVPGTVATLNLMELYAGGVTALTAVLFVLDFRRVERHPALPIFIPYIAVLALGAMRNLEPRSAAEILARYIGPLLILFLVGTHFESARLRRRLFLAMFAVGAVPLLLSLWLLAHGQMREYYLAGYHRLRGPYKNLHSHAHMMMLFSSMAGWWLLQVRNRTKRFLVGAFAAGTLLCLYLTYVRTALLSLTVFGFVFLLVERRRRVLVAAAIALVLFVAFNPAMQDRFKDIVLFFMPSEHVVHREKLGSGRWGLWTASFREYLRQPVADILLGLGLGKHWLLTREYFNPYSVPQDGYVDTHNDYLTMTYQVGPIATACYVAMQVLVIRTALRLRRRTGDDWTRRFASYAVALTAATFVANSVSNAFINRATLAWYFWTVAGLVFAEDAARSRAALDDAARPAVPP